jgi:hypothetical protein
MPSWICCTYSRSLQTGLPILDNYVWRQTENHLNVLSISMVTPNRTYLIFPHGLRTLI